MARNEEVRSLPVVEILKESFYYFAENIKAMALFVIVNFAIISLGFDVLGGWANPLFLLLMVIYYMYWTYFFRFYFDRKPYFLTFRKMADSLVPSTKIVFVSFVVLTILIFVPFIPLFVLPLEQVEQYEAFLKKYMQESTVFDLGLNVVVLVFSPIIFFRPFMAWISAIIGRSGYIKTAFQRTENNHWRMVFIALMINIPFALITQFEFMYNLPNTLIWFIASPVIVWSNLVVAKCYEFFYLGVD